MADDLEWLRWVGTSAIALGALVLGIRAEIRAVRYRATFVVAREGAGRITIANATGETVSEVSVVTWPDAAETVFLSPIMQPDEQHSLETSADQVMIHWTRPYNGYRYRQIGPVPVTMPRPLRSAVDSYREQRRLSRSKGERNRWR